MQNKAEKETKLKKEKVPMDKAKKKKIIRRSILGVVVFVIGLFVANTIIAAQNAKPIVFAQAVERGEVEQTISTSGNVKSENTKVYFADVAVPIRNINISVGDAVAKGDTLMAYDEEKLATEKQLAELKMQSINGSYSNSVQGNGEKVQDLREASTNLPVLEQQIIDTQAYITNLEDKINRKKSDLAYEGALLQISLIDWSDQPNSDEYENLKKLVQLNSYEQQNNKEIKGWQDELSVYSDMLAEYKTYRSEMKSQKSSSEASTMTSGARSELEASTQTQKIQAQDTLTSLQDMEAGIQAEFAGVVSEISVVEGGTPMAGGQLFTLQSTEDVKVEISISKYDIDKIKIGQQVDITVAGSQYQGEVNKISKIAEKNSSGTPVVATDIKILNPDENIFLGVEAKVVIHIAEVKDVVIVPVEAVNTDKDGDFIYAVENNLLTKKRVVTGISSDSYIEILEGLQEGDQILTETAYEMEEGTEVMVMPAQ